MEIACKGKDQPAFRSPRIEDDLLAAGFALRAGRDQPVVKARVTHNVASLVIG